MSMCTQAHTHHLLLLTLLLPPAIPAFGTFTETSTINHLGTQASPKTQRLEQSQQDSSVGYLKLAGWIDNMDCKLKTLYYRDTV